MRDGKPLRVAALSFSLCGLSAFVVVLLDEKRLEDRHMVAGL